MEKELLMQTKDELKLSIELQNRQKAIFHDQRFEQFCDKRVIHCTVYIVQCTYLH